MLEVRNLTKMYKPKRGVPVLAVDHINLRFPETGMVFLLGKSGSGKSTMLNLLGGLDVCDEGEIIIKGKSSANFKQRDFDSYRNTYLGFIFQEYNILEEFNVGANIALALQLQGQKATDERINQILEQVDLAGYGMRKPNELSGGQKQRVAIARALVKDPEIIMADEPTGALDSVTGRQVLDTLKRLSEQKLVIVVSHDREFAERYADRIIELADGHVISDMEYEAGDYDSFEETLESVPSGLTFTQEMVYVAPQYHLTEEDREAINNWIDAQSNGGAITIGTGNANATAMHGNRVATPTDQSRIIPLNNSPFRLIKSKLPMKNAFKIGASGLKYKKFRLVITIILSCVAFGLFGLADTLGSYDHISTCSKSIVDTGVNYASFQKSIFYKYDSLSEGYWSTGGYKMTAEDVEQIQKDTGISVVGAYVPDIWEVSETNNGRFDTQYDTETEFTETMYHIYAYGFSGIASLDEQMLEDSGFKLIAGRLADGSKDEMVISSYVAQTFIKAGYREYGSEGSFTDIQDEADMVGKTLYVGGRNMEIVGVVDTGFDLSRYESLVKENKGENSLDLVLDVALNSELRKARECSFLEMMMVGDGFVERMLEESPKVATVSETDYLEFYTEDQKGESAYYLSEDFYSTLGNIDASKVVWADGAKETLAENEIIISQSSFEELCGFLSLEAKPESLAKLPNISRSGYCDSSVFDDSEDVYSEEVKIVGYLPTEAYEDVYQETIVIDDELYKKYMGSLDGGYSFAIGAMPDKYSEVKSIVKYSYSGKNGVRYSLVNSVTYELDGLDAVFKVLSKAFMYVGLFFAIFASIMMATFISSSISYKKQEIGILRAIGARGSDVFRIFFSESFLIAMINFVLSTTGVGIATALVNRLIRRSTGLLITVLRFGIRQVILLFVISMAIAALASFFPVNHNARKRPIDAIRNR